MFALTWRQGNLLCRCCCPRSACFWRAKSGRNGVVHCTACSGGQKMYPPSWLLRRPGLQTGQSRNPEALQPHNLHRLQSICRELLEGIKFCRSSRVQISILAFCKIPGRSLSYEAHVHLNMFAPCTTPVSQLQQNILKSDMTSKSSKSHPLRYKINEPKKMTPRQHCQLQKETSWRLAI